MLTNLATFLYAHGRRVLLVAVLGAAIAGVFGVGVAKHMSPYGANDPATQSVQATNRFEAARGRKIDPGIVALVSAGDVRSAGGAAARRPGRRRAARAARRREGRQLLRHPRPARWCRATGARPTCSRTSSRCRTRAAEGRRAADRGSLRRAARREARRRAVANAQVNTQVGHDLARSELLAFPLIFLLSLLFFRSLVAALLPPLLGGLAIVATFFVLRIVASFADLSVFALNLVTGLGLGLAIDYSLFMVSRYREEAAAPASACERCAERSRPPGARSCSAR